MKGCWVSAVLDVEGLGAFTRLGVGRGLSVKLGGLGSCGGHFGEALNIHKEYS